MKEKTKVIESTQSLGNDLAGVMALQRKLTGMERDLEAIQVWSSYMHCSTYWWGLETEQTV